MDVYLKHSSMLTLALALAAGLPAIAQLQPARTIILIGPPGSGKTTQADYLRKRYKIPAISMSQLLQQEVNRKSPMGKALAASLSSGELLADSPANDLMKARLLRPDAGRGFILDGYPTTEGQARALDEWLSAHNLPKPTVIVLDLPEEVSRDRMVRRRRADDEPANIEQRLRDYKEVGRLVEQWYGPERTLRIDGTGALSDVALRIAKGIDDLQSRQRLKPRSPEDGGLKRRAPEESSPEQKQ
jgi:adenylate kinase